MKWCQHLADLLTQRGIESLYALEILDSIMWNFDLSDSSFSQFQCRGYRLNRYTSKRGDR